MIRCFLFALLQLLLTVCPNVQGFALERRRPTPQQPQPTPEALDRRSLLSTVFTSMGATTFVVTTPASYYCWAESLPVGLLESRVTEESVLRSPTYGMEAPDIVYPSYFAGTWQVASTTTKVMAPCGLALFGGNATYQRALQEVGTTLNYQSRFLPIANSGCIADREFNVKSLAKVALGINSVVDVRTATPNQFSCILAPNGSPSLLRVDLLTLQRRQERVSENRFDCSEVVQEVVTAMEDSQSSSSSSSSSRNQPTQPLLKQVETTSLYTYSENNNKITCQQRSATFLVPPSSLQFDDSPQQQLQLALYQAANNRAVDVRYYTVEYTPV